MKYISKLPLKVLLVVAVLVNIWSVFLGSFLELPACKGITGTITAVQPAATFNWVTVKTSDQEVYARVSSDLSVGDSVTVYTSDGSNYWDTSEDLVFCDGMLNKQSGFLALGIRSAKYILLLNNVVSVAAWMSLMLLAAVFLLQRRFARGGKTDKGAKSHKHHSKS